MTRARAVLPLLALLLGWSLVVQPLPVAALQAGPAEPDGGAPSAPAVAHERPRRPAHANLRVASFNIKNVLFDKHPSRTWRKRRAVIISQVLRHGIGLLGIQEANFSRYSGVRYRAGATQYIDLKNGLNAHGGHYRLTNYYSANCRRWWTWKNCKRHYRGASGADRILYDERRFVPVRRGAVAYTAQAGNSERYLAWAVFRIRHTRTKVFFSTTHLTDARRRYRRAQWREMIRMVKVRAGDLPVIVTGDMNVQKYDRMAKRMLPAMRHAGFGDVVGQRYRKNPGRHVRPKHLEQAWINSFNGGRRKVGTFGYENHRNRLGNNIDWIFATNRLKVVRWKVVLDFNHRRLRVNGVLPSDHNMVTATIRLPLRR